jgi:hypothetical protein
MLKTKYINLKKIIIVFSLLVMETQIFSKFWDVGGIGLANFSYISKRRVRKIIPTLPWKYGDLEAISSPSPNPFV